MGTLNPKAGILDFKNSNAGAQLFEPYLKATPE